MRLWQLTQRFALDAENACGSWQLTQALWSSSALPKTAVRGTLDGGLLWHSIHAAASEASL
jgi:hypothetical protein